MPRRKRRGMWNLPPESPADEGFDPDEEPDAEEELEPELEPDEEALEPELEPDEEERLGPRHSAGRMRFRFRRSRGRHAPGAPHETEPEDEDLEPDEEEPEASEDLGEIFEPPPTLGSRAARRRKKRRQRSGVGTIAAIVVGALAAIAIVGAPIAQRAGDGSKAGDAGGGAAGAREPITTLVFGTRERDSGSEQAAQWLMLFSFDPRDGEGVAVSVPAHTAAEVPGRGLQSLTDAYASGGVPLLLVSMENLVGVGIDRYLEISDRDARVLFAETGSIEVDVPEDVRVPIGKKRVRLVFVAGQQQLAAPALVRLLYTRGLDVDDIDFGSRHLAFWDALFERFDNDPPALASAITKAGPALGESDAPVDDHAAFFRALADLPRFALTLTSLPVRPVAAGADETYSVDRTELTEFVAATFEGEAPDPEKEIRVQILNGNGVPGIGQKVAERLIGEGFRVILSGNARRLDYAKTLIVTYDSSDAGTALAERARQLLGVGEVQVSAQRQGIVDLTIVVGEDFLTTL